MVIIFATEDTEVTEGGLPAGVRERLTVQALSRTLSELMRSALKALACDLDPSCMKSNKMLFFFIIHREHRGQKGEKIYDFRIPIFD